MAFFFALGRNRTRDPRVPEPKRTPLGYILPWERNSTSGVGSRVNNEAF
jgi:hypothetical protein